MKKKVELGDTVKHIVSGFEGVVTSKTEYINGCIRFCVQPKIKKGKSGELPKYEFLDLQELSIIKKGSKKVISTKTGGSRPSPLGQNNPER